MFLKIINTIIIRKKAFLYAPLVLIWAVLFILTSLPGSEMPALKISDKVIHFVSYGVLGLFLYLTLIAQNHIKLLKSYPALSALMINIIYGGFDEIHQSIIPGRSCDVFDWMADISGSLCAIIIVKIITDLIRSNYKNRLKNGKAY